MLLRTIARACLCQPSNFSNCGRAAYKSSISLDKLYPQSSLDITKAQKPPENTAVKFSGFIPMNKLKITASHSSGPGGQNVNNTNTKIDMRFKIAEADWIPEEIRAKLQTKFRSHVSREGYFIIQSDRTRFQHLNTADALEKLRECIRECEPQEPKGPSEDSIEKFRKAQEKAARDRLREKKERHMVKAHRGGTSATQLDA